MSETRKVGDKVFLPSGKYQGTWVIEKVNPTRYLLRRDDGTSRLNCDKSMVTDVPENLPAFGVPYQPQKVFCSGELVTSSLPKLAGKFYVVLADKGDKVNVALLGGDNGRYWRLPRHVLTRMTVPCDAVLQADTSVAVT